jgi:NADH-quinone oxidoreductase subunit C/D
MFSWKEFEKTKKILLQDSSYQESSGQHHITVRPVNLLRWVELAGEDLGFLTLVEIAGVDLLEDKNSLYRFRLTYHFLNMGAHQRFNLHVCFNPEETIPSIVGIFSNADWMEREQWELLGIKFNRDMKSIILPRGQDIFPYRKNENVADWPLETAQAVPKLKFNPNKSEKPYPEESYIWKNFPLYSPQAKGLFEWKACFDNDKLVDSIVDIGFYHQGLESVLASADWIKALSLVDKINFGSSPHYAVAWAKTFEDLQRVKIPERAQAIRIVALELTRIAEHLTIMHEMCFALEFDEHKLFLNAREKIYELLEKYCGHRLGVGMIRIGGVREDLPPGWIVEYQIVFNMLVKVLKTIHRSLISRSGFREDLSSSRVSAQTALQWGLSGPVMRACGLNFDLRKSQPFYFYQDIDFDVPVGIYGSAYERYLIRYEEIFQSLRIITQVIDNLPMGEVINPDWGKDYLTQLAELKKIDLTKDWHYTGLESPNGESGFLIMLNKESEFARVKIKTPSFPLVQAFPLLLNNVSEKLLIPSLVSLGIRSTELDR